MELFRFTIIYFIVIVVTNLADSLPTAKKDSLSATRKGCAKGVLSHNLKIKEVHATNISDYLSGIKRRSIESEEDDCTEKKSQAPRIHEAAVGSVHTEPKSKKSEQIHTISLLGSKKSELNSKLSDKKMHAEALSHIMKEIGAKRASSKTPNLKTLRNSPLWSLSKLIDDVSAITTKKSHKNITSESSGETHASYFPVSDKHKTGMTKATVESDGSKGLKATLAKAIAKVEKVVANKNAAVSAQRKAISVDKPLSNLFEKDKAILNLLEKDKPIINAPTNKTVEGNKKTTNATVTKAKTPPPDPYAEIAAGPDRPKLPELKGDDSAGASDGPVMKLGEGNSEQMSSAAKDAKPLSGQHDVGGLLDSLTDKLNAAGGGVASDQPISGNEVKYLQTQLGLNDETGKQAEQMPGQGPPALAPEVQGPEQVTEANPEQPPEPVPEQGLGAVDKLKDEADMNDAQRIAEASGTSKMEAPQQEEDGLDKEVMEKLANTEEGLSKSIADKANSLSKLGALDILKGAQKGGPDEMTDYSDADISPGPDPYAIPNGEPGRTASTMPVGANFNGRDVETSELLGGGSLQGTEGIERGVSEGFAQNDAAGFEQRDDGGFGEELTGNTRSRTKSDESYISEAMNAMGDTPYTTRQNIPDALWDGVKGLDSSDSYNTNYNTQMFKKNVILRPKRDNYVSPFSGRESFDNEV